jgi:4-aminobutyrate aminotransferase/(S)-3-amino-2-methylpropionate transaminase
VRALQAREIIAEIREKNLLENVNITGNYLKAELQELQVCKQLRPLCVCFKTKIPLFFPFVQNKYPSKMSNVRGLGTFLAFDVRSAEEQLAVLSSLRQKGIEATGCGVKSIRMRPMLIFTPVHADQLLERIDSTIGALPN